MIALITEGFAWTVFNFPHVIDRLIDLISLVLLHLQSDIKHTSYKDKVITWSDGSDGFFVSDAEPCFILMQMRLSEAGLKS